MGSGEKTKEIINHYSASCDPCTYSAHRRAGFYKECIYRDPTDMGMGTDQGYNDESGRFYIFF